MRQLEMEVFQLQERMEETCNRLSAEKTKISDLPAQFTLQQENEAFLSRLEIACEEQTADLKRSLNRAHEDHQKLSKGGGELRKLVEQQEVLLGDRIKSYVRKAEEREQVSASVGISFRALTSPSFSLAVSCVADKQQELHHLSLEKTLQDTQTKKQQALKLLEKEIGIRKLHLQQDKDRLQGEESKEKEKQGLLKEVLEQLEMFAALCKIDAELPTTPCNTAKDQLAFLSNYFSEPSRLTRQLVSTCDSSASSIEELNQGLQQQRLMNKQLLQEEARAFERTLQQREQTLLTDTAALGNRINTLRREMTAMKQEQTA